MAETQHASEAASVARAYFEKIAERDLDAMTAFYEIGGTGEIHGLVELTAPDGYRAWFGNLFTAFPDFRFEILDVVGEGELAAVRWHASGTFDGSSRFEGMEPNGAKIDLTGCDMLRIRDGKIHRNDAYMNGMQMTQQLGVLPATGSPAERAMIGAVNLKTRLVKALRR